MEADYIRNEPIDTPCIISRITLLVLLLGAIPALSLRAQESLRIGPMIGYEFGVPLAIDRGEGTINGHGVIGEGRSYNNSIRFGGNVVWTDLLGEDLGLSFRGGFLLGGGLFRSTYTSDREYDPITASIVPARYQYRVTSQTSAWEIDARVRFGIDAMAVEVGPWISLRSSQLFTTTFRKLGPLPAGEGALDVRLDELPGENGSAPFRFGAVVGGSYMIPYGDDLWLQPELAARLDLGALFSGLDVRSVSLGAGLSLHFDATDTPPSSDTTRLADLVPPADPPADTASGGANRPADPRDTTAPSSRALQAAIDIYSLDPSGSPRQSAAIKARLVRQRREAPFPGAIFFDNGSAVPPSRYRRTSTAEADRFTMGALAQMEIDEIYYQALSLLGLRMREQGESTVTLIGSASTNESETVALRRAEWIRDYLREIWGIDESRIAVRSGPVSQGSGVPLESDRCVRIEGSIAALTAPLMIEWNVRTFQLPPLDIQPAMKATAGVRDWEVTVRQGSDVITRYSNRSDDHGSSDLSLQIPDGSPLAPLIAELAVTDSAGGATVARDSLPLTIIEESEGSAKDLRERHDYFVSASAVPEFGGAGGRTLRDIAATVRSGDRVTVSAPAGGDGGAIADALRRLLKPRGVKVELQEREKNEAVPGEPERGMLGRMVMVQVERGMIESAGRQ